jgi:hypothetical protein
MKIVVTLKLINFSRSRLFLIIKKKYNMMARIVGGDILIFDDFVIKFGYMLRTGFEFGHFRFGLKYNGVGSNNKYPNNNYIGSKISVFFGGGRIKSKANLELQKSQAVAYFSQ